MNRYREAQAASTSRNGRLSSSSEDDGAEYMSDHDRNVDRQILNARRSNYVPQQKAGGRTAIARPQTSPFTSPSKRSARLAAAAASSAAEAAAQRSSNGTRRRPDCTCSDVQIEMGGCICAASSASDASSSSSSSSSLSPTVGSKSEWRRYEKDNIAREMRYGAAGTYESGADTREGTLSSSALRAGQNDSSNTRRWQLNANRLPPTSPSRSLRDVLNRVEARRAAASISSPSPSADTQGNPTDDNSALSTARRGRVNSRETSLAWSRSDVPTPSHISMVSAAKARNRQMSAASTVSGDLENDDVEWQRRRRREERDRLIRRRIEEKKRRASGGSTVVANGDRSMRSAATPTTTRRNLNNDLELLQRISRPPSATSVAAFAATVSPPKKGRRTDDAASWPSSENGASPRISSEPPGKTSASPRVVSLLSGREIDRAAEDSQGDTKSSLTSQSSDDGIDGPVSREPPTNSSPPAASRSSKSPGAFHFTPQRMSKEIVHPPEEVASTSASPTSSTFTSSSLSPPHRRNAHRRGQESSSSVVAVSARLPPATPLEAQRRLQRALGTSEADPDLPESLDVGDAHMPTHHSVPQNESQSLASRSVKSVRFHTSAELIAPGGEAVTVQEQLHSGRGERTRSELVDEDDLSESRRKTELASEIDDEESALATSRRTSKADPTAPSTPMRLIPGGFGTPLVNLGLNYSGADGSSFSRHVLRPTPKKQGAATPSTKAHGHLSSPTAATESPLLPGGLRLRQWTEASNSGRVDADESHQASISPSPRKCPLQGRSKDRSLPPPSYWAIAPSTERTAQTEPAAAEELRVQIGEQVVSELPRTSTPPPSSKEDMSRGADASNFDLAASLSHHLHGVDDIPSSSASSTSSSAASEAAEAPATPKADHSVEVADDSLKVTLDRFVEMVRSNGKGESRGVDLEHTDVSAAKQASEASLMALAKRLEEIHTDEEAARERSEEQKKHDAESLTRIEAARRSLSEQVEAALSSGVIDRKDGADGQDSRRYVSTRSFMAAGWLALQVCLIWVSLAVARSGAEQLYRTVYFDAFYPHLYGNGNAVIDFASVSPRAGMVIIDRHGWSSLARTFETVALRALAGLVEAIFADSAGSAAVTLPFVPI